MTAPRGLGRGVVALFAVVTGCTIGNLYLTQAALGVVARDLGVATGDVAAVVTIAQLGYMLGILLIVPLGDRADRRRLVPLLLLASSACLLLCALAPSLPALLAAVLLVGVFTVAGQLLVPLAGDLAVPATRAQAMSVVASGLVVGAVMGRVLGGIVSEQLGWRWVYGGMGAVMLVMTAVMAVVMRSAVPRLEPRERGTLPALFASLVRLFASERSVRGLSAASGLMMCAFTAFWTGLTLLLEAPPFGLPANVIGLIGVAGLLGAPAAQAVGVLIDRGRYMPAAWGGYALTVAGLATCLVGRGSIAALVVGIGLFAGGFQMVQVLMQIAAMNVRERARSRINTIFIGAVFLGGALGAHLVALIWPFGGWPAAIALEVLLVIGALVLWRLFGAARPRAGAAADGPRQTPGSE